MTAASREANDQSIFDSDASRDGIVRASYMVKRGLLLDLIPLRSSAVERARLIEVVGQAVRDLVCRVPINSCIYLYIQA